MKSDDCAIVADGAVAVVVEIAVEILPNCFYDDYYYVFDRMIEMMTIEEAEIVDGN